jgi:hypothetical protein
MPLARAPSRISRWWFAHSAFCRPSAGARKVSPPSTTWACAKPEKASRKVVEPVPSRLARDRDAKPAHVGEVRQAHFGPAGAPGGTSHSGLDPRAPAIGRRGVPRSGALPRRTRDGDGRSPRRSPPPEHRARLQASSGSGRRRPRGLFLCDGNRGSASIRYAVAVENPAFAAATAGGLQVQPRLAVGDVSAKGVKRVCIPNRSTKSIERKREQRKRWFRNGQKWRTGCEGRISVVKRRHGLDRCRYKGYVGMNRWVGLGVIADNVVNISCAMETQALS